MKPLIVVNFKAYAEATAESALNLAKICDRVAEENKANVEVVLVVQPTDIRTISKAVNIPIYTQHVDPVRQGAFTGRITAQAIKEAGAHGSLLNHSERPLSLGDMRTCMELLRNAGLKSVVCVASIEMCRDVLALNPKPDFIAYEPPELIDGDVSVSTARPELIKQFVGTLKSKGTGVSALVGAGIKTKDDVKKSLELGAHGVLIASGIVKADDPEKACKEFFSL